ncbi:hypothetical protein GOODEAATRI_010361 [Goodea atripinnis]|uniref:Uncharacterized protein n=1 Tax=Goodea atripinnis TaxID=208336 RepID=A0ABV0P4P8_9TELE
MVLKGLLPETEYQFVVRAVNMHGVSPPSHINNPVRTLGPLDVGSGDLGRSNTDSRFKDEDGFDIDDSDYDVFIEELKPFPGIGENNEKSQLRSHPGPPSGRNVVYRMNSEVPPNVIDQPVTMTASSIFSEFTDLVLIVTSEPSSTADTLTTAPPTTTRFNCGTGAAQIISESPIVLGQWHVVTIFRDGMSGWLRMDNDNPISGRSQGQYTKITFRSPLYVGGSPSAYWLVRATGTNRGFVGCIQRLTINNKATDIRPWPLGKALSGADIGFSLSSPLFNETMFSYAVIQWPQSSQSYLSFMEFEVTFWPSAPSGVLLYSDDAGSKDFLAINLVDKYVESEEQISLDSWHELRVSRTAKSGILHVDNQRPIGGIAEVLLKHIMEVEKCFLLFVV